MTLPPGEVRLAMQNDEEMLFALVRASDEEWSLLPRSYAKVRAVLRLALTDGVVRDGAGASVLKPSFAVVDGALGLEAALGLYPTKPWDSDEHYLRAFFLYVHPACRRLPHGRRLMQFAKWFGERAGLPVVFELLHPERTEAKARLFARQAVPVGGLFLHDVPAAEAVAA